MMLRNCSTIIYQHNGMCARSRRNLSRCPPSESEGQESPAGLPCSLLSALPSPVLLFCTGFRSATPSPLSTTTELDGGAARLAEEEEAEGPCLETPPAAPPTPL